MNPGLRAKTAIAAAALLALAACTYAEPKGMLDLDSAYGNDGSRAAVAVHRYLLHRPTGIAAFPDGGVAKITDQVVDVYVVDLASRKLLYAHAIDPPGKRSMVALDAWLLGWQGDDAYVRLTGCPAGFWTRYKGCHGDLRKTYVYKVSRDGAELAGEPLPELRRHRKLDKIVGPEIPDSERNHLSTDDGVWVRRGATGPRALVLRLDGQRLEPVVD